MLEIIKLILNFKIKSSKFYLTFLEIKLKIRSFNNFRIINSNF